MNAPSNPSRRGRRIGVLALVLVVAVIAFVAGRMGTSGSASAPDAGMSASAEETVWTCSMHPQIRLPEPGLCPICAMDLIPAESRSGEEGAGPTLTLSERARQLARVQTSRVEARPALKTVRLSGTLTEDPARVRRVAAWVGGRIEGMHVATEGEVVAKGDPLFDLYSPELVTGVEELRRARSGSSAVSLPAARARLRQWGLSDPEIERLAAGSGPTDRVTIGAPVSGVVTRRHVDEGAYVATGAPVYTVADLDELWLELDAAEQDLVWLDEGQRVDFTLRALPGRAFSGTVSLVEPVLDPRSRTIPVRVTVPNPDGVLRPGMIVHARVAAELDPDGGMPLVVPETAPLLTGNRAVVYVEEPGSPGTYHGREVVLGPRTEAGYVVTAGLHEGERVVTRGAFKIDSALQIRAESSMMSMEGEPGSDDADLPSPFVNRIGALLDAYSAVHEALAADEVDPARAAAATIPDLVSGAPVDLLGPDAARWWGGIAAELVSAAHDLTDAAVIADARVAFEPLSRSAIRMVRRFGGGGEAPLHVIHCPMAFDNRGADWIQGDTEVRNPYFGSAMYACGAATEELVPAMGETGDMGEIEGPGDHEHHDHEMGGHR